MAVILPDGQYVVVRRNVRPEVEDDEGVPVPSDAEFAQPDELGPYIGARFYVGEGRFRFRLDPSAWPVLPDDFLDCPDGTRLTITGEPKLYTVPGIPDVDYVGGEAAAPPPQP